MRAPTTRWHGNADSMWGPGNIPYLTGCIAGAQRRRLPEQDHMLYLDN